MDKKHLTQAEKEELVRLCREERLTINQISEMDTMPGTAFTLLYCTEVIIEEHLKGISVHDIGERLKYNENAIAKFIFRWYLYNGEHTSIEPTFKDRDSYSKMYLRVMELRKKRKKANQISDILKTEGCKESISKSTIGKLIIQMDLFDKIKRSLDNDTPKETEDTEEQPTKETEEQPTTETEEQPIETPTEIDASIDDAPKETDAPVDDAPKETDASTDDATIETGTPVDDAPKETDASTDDAPKETDAPIEARTGKYKQGNFLEDKHNRPYNYFNEDNIEQCMNPAVNCYIITTGNPPQIASGQKYVGIKSCIHQGFGGNLLTGAPFDFAEVFSGNVPWEMHRLFPGWLYVWVNLIPIHPNTNRKIKEKPPYHPNHPYPEGTKAILEHQDRDLWTPTTSAYNLHVYEIIMSKLKKEKEDATNTLSSFLENQDIFLPKFPWLKAPIKKMFSDLDLFHGIENTNLPSEIDNFLNSPENGEGSAASMMLAGVLRYRPKYIKTSQGHFIDFLESNSLSKVVKELASFFIDEEIIEINRFLDRQTEDVPSNILNGINRRLTFLEDSKKNL